MGFSLFGSSGSKSSSSTHTETNIQETNVAAGAGAVASGRDLAIDSRTAVGGGIIAGDGSTISVESPEAIQALRDVAAASTGLAGEAIAGAQSGLRDGIGKLVASFTEGNRTIAEALTNRRLEGGLEKSLPSLVIAAIAALVVIFLFRRGRA